MATVVQQTISINTPVILTDTTGIPSNPSRVGWSIQNLGTHALFVCLGVGATSSVFHYIAPKGTVNDDGTGGVVGQLSGVVFTGTISIAGTSPRYVVLEQ